MVSGKPPRHSRSTPESKTIDLDAEDVNEFVEAEAVPQDGADAGTLNTGGDQPSSQTPEETGASEDHVQSETDTGNAAETAPRNETPPDNTPQTSKPERRGGLLPAALLGGVVALAGAAGLQYAGVLASLAPDTALMESNRKLTDDIAGLKAQLDNLPKAEPVDFSAIDAKFAELETRIDKLPMADGTTADGMTRIAALSDQMAAMESKVAELGQEDAKARAALEMRLEATEKKINEPRDDVDVARAIASAGLKAAIDRGGSFMSELDTLAGISPDDPAVVELKSFAATGVPSRADLLKLFPDVASAMVGALETTDPEPEHA